MYHSPVKKSMITCGCIALCVVLTQVFHVIQLGDMFYGPLQMPVLLCGLMCGWKCGIFCAAAGVSLSTIISGTPSIVLFPVLLAECIVSAAVCGLASKKLHAVTEYRNTSLILLIAMLLGRTVGAVVSAMLFTAGGSSPFIWSGAYLASAMPGVVVLLVLLPGVLEALRNAGFLPCEVKTHESEEKNALSLSAGEMNLTSCEES